MNQHVRSFFQVPSGRGHHVPAARVGAGIAIPLLVVILAGRVDLSVYVIFGALTGVFGRIEAHSLRFRHLSRAGALMSAGVVAGAAASVAGAGPWEVVVAGTVLAGIFSVVSEWWGLRPAGPFFYLFAFTTTAAVPFTGHLWEAAVAVAGSVATVLVLGWLGLVDPRRWRPAEAQDVPTGSALCPVAVRAVRYMIAVGLAGAVAAALGWGHHNWAMLAATAPIAAAGLGGALAKAAHSIVGTYVGVGLSAVLLGVDWSPVQLALLLAVLLFASEVFVIRHQSLALVFLTPVALMLTAFVVSTPAQQLIRDRAWDTTLGAAVAVAVISASAPITSRLRAVRSRRESCPTAGQVLAEECAGSRTVSGHQRFGEDSRSR